MRIRWIVGLLIATANVSVADTGIGVRGGATLSPDQFHIGTHVDVDTGEPTIHVHPNLEIGFGSDLMVVALGGEVLYLPRTTWGAWRPYIGGGLAIVNYDVEGRGRGRSDSEFGLTVAGGIERALSSGTDFFVEAKLGLLDIPDLKLTAGWTFDI